MIKRRFVLGIYCGLAFLAVVNNLQAADVTWTGATSDVGLASNWGGTAAFSGTQVNIAHFAGAGSTTPNLALNTNFWLRELVYDAGAQAYTFTGVPGGSTYISLNAQSVIAGSSDPSPAQTALLNNSSNQQVINIIGSGKFGVAGIIDTGTAAGGSLVINAPLIVSDGSTSGSLFTALNGSNNVYFNVDPSINAAGNLGGGAWTSGAVASSMYLRARERFFLGTNFSGTAFLGNIGTSYAGTFHVDSTANGALRLTNNNSLGSAAASGNSRAGVMLYGGASANGTLELSNNITVSRTWTFLDGRFGATNQNDPHILNVSGNNTYNVNGDWNTGVYAPSSTASDSVAVTPSSGNWNIQSDSGKLTITGGNIYNTASVNTTLQLMGAGDGQIDAPLQKYLTNPTLNIVKKGAGTWTLTNANTAIGGGSTFDGNVTVMQGKLALTGSGSLANAPSIDIRSGAFFDVGSVYTLNATNLTTKGAGTITGSLVAGTSNTIAPGDSGIGTLNVSSALTLNGGGALSMELTSTPTSLSGVNDRISLGGNLTLGGLTAVNVSPVNGSLSGGTYKLITYGGSLTSGDATNNLSINLSNSARQQYLLSTGIANEVDLIVTGEVADLTWVGGVNGDIWVDGQVEPNSINWTGATGGSPDNHFYTNDKVTFGNTGTTTPVVSGSVTTGKVSITTGAGHDYTISGGNITVLSSMTLSGAGNATFTNGNITVGGPVSVTGSGTLEFANSGAALSIPGTIAINNGTLAINRTDDFTVTNGLSGSGTFRKANTNTVTTAGDNSGFSGSLNVTGGTLKAGNVNALGSSTAVTTVSSGATLDLNSIKLANGTANLAGNGVGGIGALYNSAASGGGLIPNVILSADATIAVSTTSSYNIGADFGAAVTGTGTFVGNGKNLNVVVPIEMDIKNVGDMGVNNLTISGGNVLYIAGNTTLGSTGSLILPEGGRIGFYGNGGLNAADSATGAVTKQIVVNNTTTNGSEIEIYRGNMTIASPIQLDGNLSSEIYATEATATTWTATYTGPITGTGNLGLHTYGRTTVSTATANADNFGAVVLTNNGNTYSGTTTIGGGGGTGGSFTFTAIPTTATNRVGDRITSLSIGNGGSTGSIGTGDIIINPGSSKNNNAAGTLATYLYLNRTGTYALANNIILNGDTGIARVDSIAAGNATISGVISGAGSVYADAGNITLSGNNTYSGSTVINAGRITVAHNNGLGDNGTNNTSYVQFGANDNSALLLTGGISSNKVGLFVVPHSTNAVDNGPQIISVSGSNELTGTIASDSYNIGGLTPASNFITFQSNAGANLKLSGDIRQDNPGTLNLTLRGAGNGEVSGTITQPSSTFFNAASVTGNVWNIVKEDSGTWTISGTASHTGSTTINTGKLALGAFGTMATTPSIEVKTGAFFDVSAVAGGYALTSGQTLKGTGTVIGGVSLAGGSTISPGSSPGTLSITTGDLTLSGGGLAYELTNNPSSTNDNLSVGGNVNVLSNTNFAFTPLNGLLGTGSYRLIDYVGAAIANPNSVFTYTGVSPAGRQSYSFSSVANQLNFNVTGIAASLTWVGGTGGVNGLDAWDVQTTVNWTGAPGPAFDNRFFDSDSVSFTDSATTFTPKVVGTLSPNAMTFTNSTGKNYVLSGSGSITSSGNLTASGSGNVTIANTGSNTIGGNFAASGSGNVNINDGDFTVTGSFTLSGAGTTTIANSNKTLALTGPIALNSGTLDFNRTDDIGVSSSISGAGALHKEGANALTLSGNNSGYSGAVTVSNGTLKAGSANALGASAATLNVQSGGTLDLNGFSPVNASGVTLAGAGVGGLGALYNSSASADSVILKVALSADTTIGTAAAHGYTIGDGTAASGFQGNGRNLVVNIAHEVDVFLPGDMGVNNMTITGGGPLYIAGGTTLGPNTGTLTLGDSGRLAFYANGDTNGAASSTGVIDKPIVVDNTANGGELEIYRGNKTIASPITLNGKLSVESYVRTNGTWTTMLTGPITGAGNLEFHTNSNGTSRFGLFQVTSDNPTFSGTTTIGGGGGFLGATSANDRITQVVVGNDGPTGSLGTGDIIMNPAGGTTALSLVLAKTGMYTMPNNIIMNGGANVARIRGFDAANITLSGVISGAGRVTVEDPATQMTLSGNNTYTGLTVLVAGRMVAASSQAFGDVGTPTAGYVQLSADGGNTTAVVLTNNITVGEAAFYCPLRAVNSADVGPYVISASGNNEITGTIATDSTPDAINKYYTIQSNSGSNLKISGNIVADKTGESFLTLRGAGTGEVSGGLLQPVSDFFSGAARTGNVMSIIKEDSGTWKFTGTMENTGTTTVNKGTLLVNTTHTGGGLYTVNNGGTLGGTGTIDAPVSVANGGKLSPGASIGTFTVNNSVTMLGGSSLATEIAGMTNDQLVVGGNLDLSDTSLAKILDVYRTGTGSSWVIATYAGALTGVFEKVSLGYTVNYGTGTNSQITLTATNAAGDYNNDGKVNASDYVLWRKFDGTPGGYFTWRSAFGIPPGAGSGAGIDGSAVPEPAALGLLLGAVLCAIGYRRR